MWPMGLSFLSGTDRPPYIHWNHIYISTNFHKDVKSARTKLDIHKVCPNETITILFILEMIAQRPLKLHWNINHVNNWTYRLFLLFVFRRTIATTTTTTTITPTPLLDAPAYRGILFPSLTSFSSCNVSEKNHYKIYLRENWKFITNFNHGNQPRPKFKPIVIPYALLRLSAS